MTFEQQRGDYFEALGWVVDLMSATSLTQLDDPTPCDQFNVRLLIGHFIGTAHRSLATATGTPARDVPHVVTHVTDERLGATFVDLAGRIHRAWSRLQETAPVTAPWGACTAIDAVRGFTIETIAHGWDLAAATGQPRDVLDAAAQRCLLFAAATIPDRLRGVMYDRPVRLDGPASATDRLANYLGRHSIATVPRE